MGARPGSLWREHDFFSFWLGETVSGLGTQVTFVALPMAAVLTLGAGVSQLGLLRFAEYLPYLAFTLPFGILADRFPRRTLMSVSYAARGALVGVVPVLAALGLLRLWNLVVVAFAVGLGAALFEVCWLSYVPGLVRPDRLVDANGKMAASHSGAEAVGPGLGGLLVQVLTAPYALALDSASYLLALLSLGAVRRREPPRVRSAASPRQVVTELAEGIRFAFGQPVIRATAFSAAVGNFFALVTETIFLVYAVRNLNLGAGLLGLVLTSTGFGGLLGAALANTVIRRAPVGVLYVAARLVGGIACLLLPLASGPKAVVVAACAASFFFNQAALAVANVLSSSLRQALSEDRIRGRMNASVRTLVFGALPLGSIAAGGLGSTLGLRATLWLGAIGYAAAVIPIIASPIPRLTAIPGCGGGHSRRTNRVRYP